MSSLSLFDYSFPKELIAQHPPAERDVSRMMVVDRIRKNFTHKTIRDFPDYLRKGDLLVFNNTKVFPARLIGKGVEILLLSQKEKSWRCLGKPFKKIKEGMRIDFAGDFSGTIVKKENGFLEMELHGEDIEQKMESFGLPPLPPYIHRRAEAEDKERYQSIFARCSGSAAAPTASLHFSPALMEKIKVVGVETAFITLHVSTDTFLPVRVQEIEQHTMHGENFFIPKETQEKIARAKRVIAVGTTVVRALESDWSQPTTRLFITPGFEFKIVDALLTNFHQPQSTLLMLVSAFVGREFILEAYKNAIAEKYRLFSYGDCMLIL